MYLCVCNALRESQVRRAVREEGACHVDEVFQVLEAEVCCGRCRSDIEAVLRAEGVGPDCRSCPTVCALGLRAG